MARRIVHQHHFGLWIGANQAVCVLSKFSGDLITGDSVVNIPEPVKVEEPPILASIDNLATLDVAVCVINRSFYIDDLLTVE